MTEMNGHRPTLNDLWPQCAAHLQPALDFGRNLHSLADVRASIDAGQAQLWPAGSEGSIVTDIKAYPSGDQILNFWLAGGSLAALVAAEPIIANWARERGCNAAQILGRKGWARALPHYRHVANVLWRPLKEQG